MNRAIIGVVFLLGAILSFVPLANAQSTFSWSLTCKGSKFAFFGGSAFAEWNWTVNGVAENAGSGTTPSCGAAIPSITLSGSGTVPANANGIIASVIAHAESGRTCTASTSQSFSNKGSVSINNLSVSCQGVEDGKTSFIEATFNLKS